MEFPVISNSLNIIPISIIQTSSNCAVTAKLWLVYYPDKFSSRFYIFHVNIYNLPLFSQTVQINNNACFRCNYAVLILTRLL